MLWALFSQYLGKEETMCDNNGEYFFGFADEAAMLDWVVTQFAEHANTVVRDVRDIVVSEDRNIEGCCELCYSEDVFMKFMYEDVALKYKGTVSVASGYRDFNPNYYPWDVDAPE